MKPLYFTRHGETDWNVARKICGITDIPLDENGRSDAWELARKISEGNFGIEEILHSPLSRAAETAKIVSEKCGIPARSEPLLVERNCGRFEGTLNTSQEFLACQRQICDDYSGGESMLRVCQRIYNLLDRLKSDGRTYLLVGHNGIARAVRSYFDHKMTTDEFISFRMKNCELLKFEF